MTFRTLLRAALVLTCALALRAGAAAGEPAGPADGAAKGEDAGKPVPDAELRKLLTAWGAAQKTLKTIRVKFVRAKTTALLDEPEFSEGNICIEKPDGYRQEIFEKNGKGELEYVGLIVLKPPYVWVYTPRLKSAEQVDLTKLRGAGKESPLKALGDIISFDETRIRKRFGIKAFRLADGTIRLEYAPLEGQSIGNLEKVRVWMKPGARFPLKRETTDGSGDQVIETYSDPEFDKPVNAEAFTFKCPRGVELKKLP